MQTTRALLPEGRRQPSRRRAAGRACALTATLAVAAALLLSPVAAAQCLDCHADRDFLESVMPDPARALEPLLVDEQRFADSVHGGMDCSDCHMDYDDVPHTEDGMSFDCTGCHSDQSEVLASSVHGQALEGGASVSCGACHGVHDVLPSSDRNSRLHPLNVYKACGQCHFSTDVETASVTELLREPYTDDAHARGLLRGGLTVAATCVSCHGGHDVKPQGDPESRVSRLNVEATCEACHVGVAEQYAQSVHAVRKNGDEQEGATCSDCHRPHTMAQADDDFRTQTIATCAECHAERMDTFGGSYHGKATGLGIRGEVATCSACHGNHAIFNETDPRSMVHADNVVETCAQCHPGSHAEFARIDVHADPTDPERNPQLHLVWEFMRWLLIGVLIFGLSHVLLWLNRAIAAGALRRKPRHAGRFVRRWPLAFVVFHVWMMSTVLLLAGTGLPLHYSHERWAMALMTFFGGPSAAAWVHRFCAISLGALGLSFLGYVLWRAFVKRERGMFTGPDSMMPRWQDVLDLVGTVRWFLFRGPQPKYDRWTYWEKFDFWAATWGLFVIGLSGLILWFPEQATHFVPGWFVNAALVVHGIEALLDIAFIFTVHAFHANLRPGKFPMDTMYLTGRIPVEEFREERPVEYARVMEAGTLESLVDDPPSRRLRITAYVLGFAALGTGFFFILMMLAAIWAG
ncbi:MAG: cytochrome c3 family protein [Planctomycetota bacterium]